MNSRLRNSDGGTSGSGAVRMRRTNTAMPTTADDAGGDDSAVDPAACPGLGEGPRCRRQRDDGDRRAGEVEAATACARPASPGHGTGADQTSAATGTLMRNAHRQPGPSTSHPPTNGPIAPATPLSPDHAPTAAGRSVVAEAGLEDRQAARREQRRPDALQDPAATSTSMLGATPHSSDAAANHTVPITKTRRRPRRSPSAPPRRISEASASR